MIARLRAAWAALMGTTAIVATPAPDPAANQPKGMKISPQTEWEARRSRRPLPMPDEVFGLAKPMPGVLPAGLAMDACCPPNDVGAWGAAAIMDSMMHEGLAFLGYPYLAQLTQRAEYRHATEIWAEHATRNWIDLKGDDTKVKELGDELDRLGARDAIEAMLNLDGHFGRGHLFLDLGDADNDREITRPLKVDKRKINPSRPLRALKVVEPYWCYPGTYETRNPLSQRHYTPTSWYVNGRTVHASRFLTLIGRPVPDMLKPAYAFGGMSLTQMMKPYVDNWLRTRQSVSDMAHSYSTMVFKTNMDAALQGDGAATGELFARVGVYNDMRDNQGVMVVDKSNEDVTNVAVPISGLDKLQAQAQEQLSSVSRIPLSIYLQITPTGLNASSEGETRSFYADVKSLQEKKVDPILRTIINVVQLSLWGEIDPEITYEYVPLWQMSDAERATMRKTDADTDVALINAGVVSPDETRERHANDESSLYHGALKGPAPEPEDEEDPRAANDEGVGELAAVPFGDGWNPEQPRDERGRWSPMSSFAQHVKRALASGKEHSRSVLGVVTAANASHVREQTGTDISGYTRVADSSEIRHVFSSHGDPAKEDAREQIAITPAALREIPNIIENAHSIRLIGVKGAAKPPRLEYIATINGNEHHYVEEIRDTNTLVALKSMLIKK